MAEDYADVQAVNAGLLWGHGVERSMHIGPATLQGIIARRVPVTWEFDGDNIARYRAGYGRSQDYHHSDPLVFITTTYRFDPEEEDS